MSASGQLVVTADDRRAWVWDAATGTIRQGLLLGPSGDITGVAFADGEDKVVACSADGSITIWSVTSGLLRRLGVGSPIFGMAAIPGQDRVVTFGSHLVMVWNATSGKPLRALDNSGNLQGLTVSSSGEVVAACRRSETGRAQQSVAIFGHMSGEGSRGPQEDADEGGRPRPPRSFDQPHARSKMGAQGSDSDSKPIRALLLAKPLRPIRRIGQGPPKTASLPKAARNTHMSKSEP